MSSFAVQLLCKCKTAHEIPNWSYSVAPHYGYVFTAGIFAAGLVWLLLSLPSLRNRRKHKWLFK